MIHQYGYSAYVNEFGKPIKITPKDSQYGYDGYVTWMKSGSTGADATDSVYSDRLFREDIAKFERLMMEVFNSKGQYFNNDPDKIEQFLNKFYNGKIKLELIYVMQYCNKSDGNPYWRFAFKKQTS